MIAQDRSALDQSLHRGVLAVEDAQRIALQAPAAVPIENLRMRLEVAAQCRPVALARRRGAEGIEQQAYARYAEAAPQSCAERNQLGVDVRTGIAAGLDTELVEFPETPLLRPSMAEHRTRRPQFKAWPPQKGISAYRVHDAGRAPRAQRE